MARKRKLVKIAVANQKGGAGKTTTSICLAQELQKRGYSVLFIDTDHQCNSTQFYEAETDGVATVLDILCGDEPAENCIQQTEKGDIIAADPKLEEAETSVKMNERRYLHLKRCCEGVEDKYSFIIIDTPPSIDVATKNVLNYVDYVIIPVDESGWAMTGLMNFAEAVDLARDFNPTLKVAGILTVKAKERTRKSARMSDVAANLAGKLKTRCFNTKIRESVSCTEALTEYFVPLHEYSPKSTTYQDYVKFVDELLEVI